MKNNARFLQEWFSSHIPVFDVAMLLRKKEGLVLRVPVPELRDHAADRLKFFDEGDIEVVQLIEVKLRGFDFTCAEDYGATPNRPDGYPLIYVDETYKFKRKRVERLLYYVIMSKSKSHIAVIDVRKTFQHWQIVGVNDSTQGGKVCETYGCPRELATFYAIEGALKPAEMRESKRA
jgi:hypothetical protein